MSNKAKGIDIKNRIFYSFNDMINITDFDLNNIKIDEKSYKNVLIYYIGYVAIKDLKYVNIILNKGNGYFKEINIKLIFNASFY